jgi:hypothetical protein
MVATATWGFLCIFQWGVQLNGLSCDFTDWNKNVALIVEFPNWPGRLTGLRTEVHVLAISKQVNWVDSLFYIQVLAWFQRVGNIVVF